MARLRCPSFHPQAPISRLFSYLRLLFHLKASLQEVDLPPCTTNAHNLPVPVDPDALCRLLVKLGRRLRPRLPDDREWLEEGSIEAISDSPVDAGEVADILVGMKGNLKVAIKHYRFYSSSDPIPTYTVSIPNI